MTEKVHRQTVILCESATIFLADLISENFDNFNMYTYDYFQKLLQAFEMVLICFTDNKILMYAKSILEIAYKPSNENQLFSSEMRCNKNGRQFTKNDVAAYLCTFLVIQVP